MQRLFLFAVALVLSAAPAFAQDATRGVMTLGKPSGTSVTAAPAPSSLVNLVADPSFEAGRPPAQTAWVGTNPAYIAGSPILGPTTGGPEVGQTGSFYVVLGSSAGALESGATQQVNVPAGTYTLTFRLLAGSNAGAVSSFFITLGSLELFRATEANVATYTGAFVTVTRQITVTAGGSQTLSLLSSKPAGPLINWFIDDVSIEAAASGPSLAANPASVAFGAVGTGQSSTRTITLTNSGTAATTITSITGSGAPFTVNTTGTSLTLAAGATTTFTVTYAPTAFGASTGSVNIVSNAPGSPLVIALTGNGVLQTTIPPGTTVGGPRFNRGNGATCVQATGTEGASVAYATRTFTVATAGSYTITTTYPTTFDGYINLYQGTFNPAASCTNRIAFNDDFGTGSQIANQTLAAGTYVLVITGFNDAAAGTFTGTVGGPAAVTFAPVAGEDTADNSRSSLSASPNPTRDAARVRFTTATAQDVSVSVFDVTGREVAALYRGAVAADQTVQLSLDATSLPSGVYVVRAVGTTVNLTQRVTVVR